MSKRKLNDKETTKEGHKQKRIECLENEIIRAISTSITELTQKNVKTIS